MSLLIEHNDTSQIKAPTNEAFAKLDPDVLDSLLLPENKDQLTSILTYHAVSGAVQSTDLSNGQEVETLNGDTVQVTLSDEGVMINDATVTTPDVEASNGVIHVINEVLMPLTPEPTDAPSKAPSKPPSLSPTPAPTEAPNPSPPIAEGDGSGIEPTEGTGSSGVKTSDEKTIVEIASGDMDNFSTLVTALQAAGLVDTLSSGGPFTVFGK